MTMAHCQNNGNERFIHSLNWKARYMALINATQLQIFNHMGISLLSLLRPACLKVQDLRA